MHCRHATISMLLALAGTCGDLAAQYVYSQALAYPGGRLAINLRLVSAQPNTSFAVSVQQNPLLLVTAPASTTSDAAGYACFMVDVRRTVPNSVPLQLAITLKDSSLPNGMLTRSYLLRAVNGELASAWPEFLQIQGAFCNPVNAASAHLEIDRTVDLDGDGLYGDVNMEATASGRAPLDYPSEFSTDCNAQGTLACNGGSPPGVFYPGNGSGRTVAFCADNRIVTGTCSFTTVMNFIQDLAFTKSFNGAPALFATGTQDGNILICRDKDGDGSITANEIKVFFDPKTLVNNESYSPDGVAIDPTAPKRVWWISKKSGAMGSPTYRGLYCLDDANGNDVIDANEWVASWTGSTPIVQVESQNIDAAQFECLHVDGSGAVLLNHTGLGTIFRWVDSNRDGIVQTGEVSNWLTYNLLSSLTKSADFANNAAFPVLPGTYWAMNLIESASGVGTPPHEVYYVAWTLSTGVGAGFIFRCEDKNGNGTVNDPGEVTVFNDPSLSTDPYPPNFVSGLSVAKIDTNGDGAISDSEVYVYAAEPNGPKPSCGYTTFNDLCTWRFRDGNGNGNATDPGEGERISIHPTGAFNRGLEVIPGPLDGGFRETFYTRSTLVVVQHAACMTALGESVQLDFRREKLEEGTQGTPFGGNTQFALLTRGNGTSGSPLAAVALSPTLLASPFSLLGCQLWLGAPIYAGLIPPAAPDASGEARFALPIPPLVRGTVYLQALVLQGGKLTLGEAGEMRIE